MAQVAQKVRDNIGDKGYLGSSKAFTDENDFGGFDDRNVRLAEDDGMITLYVFEALNRNALDWKVDFSDGTPAKVIADATTTPALLARMAS
jgi:hypothetical protein